MRGIEISFQNCDGFLKGYPLFCRFAPKLYEHLQIKTQQIVQTLVKLCEQHEVKFVWVRGHDGNPGNERANQLSKKALDRENLLIDTIYEEDKVQMTQPTLF